MAKPKQISKKNAKAAGLRFYYTGKQCAKGHLSERTVSSSNCVECNIENKTHNAEQTKLWKANRMKDPSYAESIRENSRLASKAYHTANRESCLVKMKARNSKYYQVNKDKIISAVSLYNASNKKKVADYKLKWHKEKLKLDPKYKMAQVARRLLHRALGIAGNVKAKNTQKYHNYTSCDLVNRLESTFVNGMSWDNYGEWHIDHIKPVKSFVDVGQYDPAVINSLDNLQALWAKDNMAKGARYEC